MLPPYPADETANDFKVDFGSPGHVLDASSSPLCNWLTFGAGPPGSFGKPADPPAADANYNTTDPPLSGWVFDVTCEFKISGDLAIDWLSNDAMEIVHASPNKIGGKVVDEFTVTDTTVIPEPLTVFGVVLGVGGLERYVRRCVVDVRRGCRTPLGGRPSVAGMPTPWQYLLPMSALGRGHRAGRCRTSPRLPQGVQLGGGRVRRCPAG